MSCLGISFFVSEVGGTSKMLSASSGTFMEIYEFSGNFVEEEQPELKELDTESGNKGASHWSILGWAGLCTCVVVLTCVIGYFKKSIE